MFNWQTLVVAVALLAAGFYLGWRGWLRIRSIVSSKPMNLPACSGCSGCSAEPCTKSSSAPSQERGQAHLEDPETMGLPQRPFS
jgi:hypothetical protein